jgi:coproporphyrinogen III oxidase
MQPARQSATTLPTQAQKEEAARWFTALRDRFHAALEAIEDEYAAKKGGTPGRFEKKPWKRNIESARAVVPEAAAEGTERTAQTDGGVMGLMKGQVFEKAGVNVSTVFGHFSPEFRKQIPGAGETGQFWASGLSMVIHPRNPLVPAMHSNTRHIVTTQGWFGGGADLNPALPHAEDTEAFHAALKKACDAYSADAYPAYKKWCEEYFFIPHRNVARGVGGIFYDNLDSGDWARDFAFTQSVGEAALEVYPKLVRRHMFDSYTPEQREQQLIYRGRYAEFNLVYDRGTKFGLATGGNTEAILMSLPPEAKWP